MAHCDKSLLNTIYQPMCEKAKNIKNAFIKAGYKADSGFYNNHYTRSGTGFIVEHFPIPVLGIENVGDIGVDVDAVWVEIILEKEKALLLDYPDLIHSYSIEIYGADSYLHDFYNKASDISDIKNKIKNSDELQIGITFTFPKDCAADALIRLAEKIKFLLAGVF